MNSTATRRPTLPKAPTGIPGLDDILGGGVPRGRPTLICGGAGCGKTLLSVEFLVNGATRYDEPGVLVSFEETGEELAQNVASLGFDLPDLIHQKKLYVDHVRIDRSEIEEAGEYSLDGLFVRLGHSIDTVGARRIVVDTSEALFTGFNHQGILRAELRRLFRWLKDRGMTTLVTAERGASGAVTRYGFEEYVSDCVISLDNRVHDQISTRWLRIVKYRGSAHSANEYPFLIDDEGISVFPVTSLTLSHEAPEERISTGIDRLDTMLGGGIHRASTVLITGTAGTGKTSITAQCAAAAAERGERCLFFAFEESPAQLVRNMRSIGVDLAPHVESGLLCIHPARPAHYGVELHLATMHRAIEEFRPQVVVVDPVTTLTSAGTETEVETTLMRLIDFLKSRQITMLFTSLTRAEHAPYTEVGVSSLVDTWIMLRTQECGGERNRVIEVLKSRGSAHSNQLREFELSARGIELIDVYRGPGGVLTGAARYTQEAQERAAELVRRQEIERKKRAFEHRRQAMEAQIAMLRAGFEAEQEELQRLIDVGQAHELTLEEDRDTLARLRGADVDNGEPQSAEG